VNPIFKGGLSVLARFLMLVGISGALTMTGCNSAPKAPEKSTFDSVVKATQPLAYYRLESARGSSEVGGTTYEFIGGVTNSSPGVASGLPENHFAVLNGKDGWIKTTQMGGIDKAGSIMA
jgi:hypothetical protein